jgi:hypothetical protein
MQGQLNPFYRRVWFALALAVGVQFAAWCIADWLYVRFGVYQIESALAILPFLALALGILLPAHTTRRRRIVGGTLIGISSTMIAVLLVVMFCIPFHFAIGGKW